MKYIRSKKDFKKLFVYDCDRRTWDIALRVTQYMGRKTKNKTLKKPFLSGGKKYSVFSKEEMDNCKLKKLKEKYNNWINIAFVGGEQFFQIK